MRFTILWEGASIDGEPVYFTNIRGVHDIRLFTDYSPQVVYKRLKAKHRIRSVTWCDKDGWSNDLISLQKNKGISKAREFEVVIPIQFHTGEIYNFSYLLKCWYEPKQ